MAGKRASDKERCLHIADQPQVIYDPSFEDKDAKKAYSVEIAEFDYSKYRTGYMPDEVTRTCARQMHYAAYRLNRCKKAKDIEFWKRRYYDLRDRIILGNHKLIFRAVNKCSYASFQSDDLIGECYIVMIRVVAAYNPWLGIRFSTYAFTCLMRALARMSGRLAAAERVTQPLSYDVGNGLESLESEEDETFNSEWNRVAKYLRGNHPLLSKREKTVLKKRFSLDDGTSNTLEEVGKELGISKERVRQIQMSALGKLKHELISPKAS